MRAQNTMNEGKIFKHIHRNPFTQGNILNTEQYRFHIFMASTSGYTHRVLILLSIHYTRRQKMKLRNIQPRKPSFQRKGILPSLAPKRAQKGVKMGRERERKSINYSYLLMCKRREIHTRLRPGDGFNQGPFMATTHSGDRWGAILTVFIHSSQNAC